MSLQHELDHAGKAVDRFAQQFKDKARMAAVMAVFTKQVQAIEDVFWDLYTKRWIDTAEGAQLDVIGRIVGQARDDSADDTEYRIRIKARVLTNRSSGTMKDIYRIFAVLLPGVSTLFAPGYPAGFEFFLNTTITAPYAALYASFLFAAKVAGVGANLIWYPEDDALMFFTEQYAGFNDFATLVGDTSVHLKGWADSSSLMPLSGKLLVGEGTPDEEDVTYTWTPVGPTPPHGFVFTVSALVHAHPVNTAWAVVGTHGLGFGDTSNPATGGALAGVIGG